MKKNCSNPVGKHQKLLLKVSNCLWNQYVDGKTNNTKTYLASPTSSNYDTMAIELKAIGDLLNNSDAIVALNALVPEGGVQTYVNIAAIHANGDIAYLYSSLGPDAKNLGTTKTLQVLNTDECVPIAYQVKPSLSTNIDNTWITESIVTARSGCSGVSNTGFISMSIEGDITVFPFNPCFNNSCVPKPKCSDKSDKSNKSNKSCKH